MADVTITWDQSDGSGCLTVAGRLCTDTLHLAEPAFAKLSKPSRAGAGAATRIDLTQVTALDTGGAWLVADLQNRIGAELTGVSSEQSTLIAAVTDAIPEPDPTPKREPGFIAMLARLGQSVYALRDAILSFLEFFGMTLHRLVGSLLRPWRLRPASLVSQMQSVGLQAVPIVALMGFLIGVVLAFQGAAQLQQFGAEVFVVELISISILRELGILLTAIIVAGRSGSAFTASIGSMKVQEEIDAMRTLGLDPMEVLVVPRVLALLIMLPILGFVANMAGLIGGGLMSWISLNVSPQMFVTRLFDTTSVWNVLIGMIKAPFFAVVIGVVACWQGMQVRGSADSVGQKTTASVVQGIFLVIMLDALFSIFFAELGV